MPTEQTITTSGLEVLCARLSDAAGQLDAYETWPREQIEWCNEAGVFRWFIEEKYGGLNWSDPKITEGYLALSRSCMTTTFILTQWSAACRRIAASASHEVRDRLLPQLANGDIFATVAISHLSTSRQHAAKPVLTAQRRPDGSYVLNGYSPWVTGGAYADYIVVGATLPDANQILCLVPRLAPGVVTYLGQRLVALTSSCTDKLELQNVIVPANDVLSGPLPNVMQSGLGGGTGGLQTSTLALGLASAASSYLQAEARNRSELLTASNAIDAECQELLAALMNLNKSAPNKITPHELRTRANSLVLRATQAALTAAKGSGFVCESPIGRWAKEALFFLVWSCPQAVLDANLSELAKSEGDACPSL